MRIHRGTPVRLFLVTTFGLALALAAAIWWYGHPLDALQSWLIAITLVTFLAYGYDKAIAGSGWTRVPERVLLILAISGGTIGALAGMRLFRHKTAKESFRTKLLLVILLQVALIAACYTLIMRQT